MKHAIPPLHHMLKHDPPTTFADPPTGLLSCVVLLAPESVRYSQRLHIHHQGLATCRLNTNIFRLLLGWIIDGKYCAFCNNVLLYYT
jgi:hypothetical protein